MIHRKQPPRSNSCGQHVVAMIADMTPAIVQKTFGSGKTSTLRVHKMLVTYGFNTPAQLIRGTKFQHHKLAILKVTWPKTTHWVVWHDKQVWDSVLNAPCTLEQYLDSIEPYGRITSHMWVEDIRLQREKSNGN